MYWYFELGFLLAMAKVCVDVVFVVVYVFDVSSSNEKVFIKMFLLPYWRRGKRVMILTLYV